MKKLVFFAVIILVLVTLSGCVSTGYRTVTTTTTTTTGGTTMIYEEYTVLADPDDYFYIHGGVTYRVRSGVQVIWVDSVPVGYSVIHGHWAPSWRYREYYREHRHERNNIINLHINIDAPRVYRPRSNYGFRENHRPRLVPPPPHHNSGFAPRNNHRPDNPPRWVAPPPHNNHNNHPSRQITPPHNRRDNRGPAINPGHQSSPRNIQPARPMGRPQGQQQQMRTPASQHQNRSGHQQPSSRPAKPMGGNGGHQRR